MCERDTEGIECPQWERERGHSFFCQIACVLPFDLVSFSVRFIPFEAGWPSHAVFLECFPRPGITELWEQTELRVDGGGLDGSPMM